MTSKYVVAIVFAFCSILAAVIIGLSIGVYLPTFSIVLIPTFILQTYVGIRAFRAPPTMAWLVLLSGFIFLAFSLLRPDADTHGQYSGYGVLCYHLGLAETEHTEPGAYFLEISLILLLGLIFLDSYIVRHKVSQSAK